jgi:hypothetical protein
VTRILDAAQNRPRSEVGFFHIRPPSKPVTLGELASLDLQAIHDIGGAIETDATRAAAPSVDHAID